MVGILEKGVCVVKFAPAKRPFPEVFFRELCRREVVKHRDVAQPGLEYSSGGRVVASSNLVIPTDMSKKERGRAYLRGLSVCIRYVLCCG